MDHWAVKETFPGKHPHPASSATVLTSSSSAALFTTEISPALYDHHSSSAVSTAVTPSPSPHVGIEPSRHLSVVGLPPSRWGDSEVALLQLPAVASTIGLGTAWHSRESFRGGMHRSSSSPSVHRSTASPDFSFVPVTSADTPPAPSIDSLTRRSNSADRFQHSAGSSSVDASFVKQPSPAFLPPFATARAVGSATPSTKASVSSTDFGIFRSRPSPTSACSAANNGYPSNLALSSQLFGKSSDLPSPLASTGIESMRGEGSEDESNRMACPNSTVTRLGFPPSAFSPSSVGGSHTSRYVPYRCSFRRGSHSEVVDVPVDPVSRSVTLSTLSVTSPALSNGNFDANMPLRGYTVCQLPTAPLLTPVSSSSSSATAIAGDNNRLWHPAAAGRGSAPPPLGRFTPYVHRPGAIVGPLASLLSRHKFSPSVTPQPQLMSASPSLSDDNENHHSTRSPPSLASASVSPAPSQTGIKQHFQTATPSNTSVSTAYSCPSVSAIATPEVVNLQPVQPVVGVLPGLYSPQLQKGGSMPGSVLRSAVGVAPRANSVASGFENARGMGSPSELIDATAHHKMSADASRTNPLAWNVGGGSGDVLHRSKRSNVIDSANVDDGGGTGIPPQRPAWHSPAARANRALSSGNHVAELDGLRMFEHDTQSSESSRQRLTVAISAQPSNAKSAASTHSSSLDLTATLALPAAVWAPPLTGVAQTDNRNESLSAKEARRTAEPIALRDSPVTTHLKLDVSMLLAKSRNSQLSSGEAQPTASTVAEIGAKAAFGGSAGDGERCRSSDAVRDSLEREAVARAGELYWREIKKQGDIYTPRYHHDVARDGKKVYVFGGDTGNFYTITKFLNDLFEYDTDACNWKKLLPASSLPAGRSGHTMVAWKKRLHVFGGTSKHGPMNDFWTYDKKMNVWAQRRHAGGSKAEQIQTSGALIPPPRAFHSCVLSGDFMFVYGGCAEDDYGAVWIFNLKNRKWHRGGVGKQHNMLHSLPAPRKLHTATTWGDWMLIFGGMLLKGDDSGNVVDELWRFHTKDFRWERLIHSGTAHPGPRIAHASVQVGSRWFVQGGRQRDDVGRVISQVGDAWCYNMKQDRWSLIPASLVPFCQSARWGHKLLLVKTLPGNERHGAVHASQVQSPFVSTRSILLTGGVTVAPLPLQ